MRFAHLADCHIGGWRDPKMKELPQKAFALAIDRSIEKNADFVLISGDLFNTSHPQIDSLKLVVSKLRELKEKEIAVYMIAGSHDFSATGKTMLDVLEEAGLAKNVVKGEVVDGKLRLKFTIDPKTGAKITGMLGRKGSLEKSYYEDLEVGHLEEEKGFKIFMFHSAISELKPEGLEKMESQPLSLLPKGFDYYAGGHVHIVEKKSLDGYNNLVYPGPIFPNSFKELETLKTGGFYFYDQNKTIYERILLYNVCPFSFSAQNRTPESLTSEIIQEISKNEFVKTIVLLRVEGVLKGGKPTDVDFQRIISTIYDKGAYFAAKNTSKLQSEEFEEINIKEDSADKIEEKLIDEHKREQKTFSDEKKIIKALMRALSQEKMEDEKAADYEKRIIDEANKILDV